MDSGDKPMTMKEAVNRYVNDGDSVYIAGFMHHEPYGAAHEIIRQKKTHLTVTKSLGALIVDELIGAGCVDRVITSHFWNPIGPRPVHAFIRAVTEEIPRKIEVEEYSLLAFTSALMATSLGLTFMPVKSMLASDLSRYSTFLGDGKVKTIDCPFTGEKTCLVPALKHKVGFIHVQRADAEGNAQAWGLLGDAKYGIHSCDRIVVSAEELVDGSVVRQDPERTLVPSFRVDAVVAEPWSGHPSYMLGYYDRDREYFLHYAEATKTVAGFEEYLEKWVYGVENRAEYLSLVGEDRLQKLAAVRKTTGSVNYGVYTQH